MVDNQRTPFDGDDQVDGDDRVGKRCRPKLG